MRKIDEAEERAVMLKKKRKILAVAAFVVTSFSMYGWWCKTTPTSNAALIPKGEIVEASRKAPGNVIVYVSGRVEHPGLVQVHVGERTLDAVNAAGGLLAGADVSKVNLAQAVRDGMQIHVPGQVLMQIDSNTGKYPVSPSPQIIAKVATCTAVLAEGKININTADAAELDKLPGVGPAMAAKIVEWRNTNGPFKAGEDLKKVKGIGEAKYQKLKDKISW